MKNTSPSGALNSDKLVTMAVDPAASAMTVQQVLAQVALIQQIMGASMKDGEHYGRIPGCGDKPTLLKPGAEKLCLTFRLAPTYEVDERNLDRSHREYRVQCTLSSILTNAFIGQGVGSCSTMEAKYRFRSGAAEPTERPVPRAYWDLRQEDPAKAQELIGGKGFTTKKVEGKGWMIAKGGEKVETDNPADHYNTVLKMAKKRALVDAVLTATAASDCFTQDLEDITANIAAHTSAGAGTNTPCASPLVDTTAPAAGGGADAEPAPALVIDDETHDFREIRIHWGKNRGLMLSELTPQQVHWYETDWMPKKEVNGPTSVEDLALINALKAYRAWRGGQLPSGSDWREVPHGNTVFGKLAPWKLLEAAFALTDLLTEGATSQERAKCDAAYLGMSTHIREHTDRTAIVSVVKMLEDRGDVITPTEQKLLADAKRRLAHWPDATRR